MSAPTTAAPRTCGEPWPHRSAWLPDGDLAVDGVPLRAVAKAYGTPAYVISERHVRDRCRAYRQAFPGVEVAFAGKAFLCGAMARWVHEEGLWLDVSSSGELAVARAVGFPPERLLLHGNAKTPRDLAEAAGYGVGRVVLDSVGEINRVAVLATRGHPQRVRLRVTPGIAADTHRSLATGSEKQKFGLSITSGIAAEAARRVLDRGELVLSGLHCHIGSQITEVEPFVRAARRVVGFLAQIRERYGVTLGELDLGGGHGVVAAPGQPGLDLAELGAAVLEAVRESCAEHRLPVPRLLVEPGRSIVANAGVILYHVVAVKPRHDGGVYVAVDGGMSDNPRPALYGAQHTVALVGRSSRASMRPATIVGRHCEAGDVLVHDVDLPRDVRPGDLVAFAGTGAYTHSMASTYNLVPRSPVIAVRAGTARAVVRRETESELLARDLEAVPSRATVLP